MNQLHLATENSIVFARRGKRARQNALRSAVETGVAGFKERYKTDVTTTVSVHTSQPIQEPALQAVDYLDWAVQRAFERQEMRYFEFLREKIELVWDIFDFEKFSTKEGCIYDRKRNPFDIEKPVRLAKTRFRANGMGPTFTKTNRSVM